MHLLLEACKNLLFPPLCLHCKKVVDDPSHDLCQGCTAEMSVIDHKERCCYCFQVLEEERVSLCTKCLYRYPPYYRLASVFDYRGPPATLIKQMKYYQKPWLAKSLAAYAVYQLFQLNWPSFDAIIPMPITWVHWMQRGYNQTLHIAEHLSSYLSVPILEAVERKTGEIGQSGKSKRQRKQLSGTTFKLKHSVNLTGKTILLVDDVMTTGTTIEKCADVLLEGCPHKIYVLTCCRAL